MGYLIACCVVPEAIGFSSIHHSGAAATKKNKIASTTTKTSSSAWMLSNNHRQRQRRKMVALNAKPKQSFNLAEIEALEQQLDREDEDEEELENEDDDIDEDAPTVQLTIPPELDNSRIDNALLQLLTELYMNDNDKHLKKVSRSQCGTLLSNGCVRILGRGIITKKAHLVEAGEEVAILASALDSFGSLLGGKSEDEIIRPQDIPIEVLYEDKYMLVVNKSAGIVVHPAAGNWEGTLVNAVAHHLMYKSDFGSGDFVGSANDDDGKDENGEAVGLRPGIVHRLDKGTTGVIVVAKTKSALSTLSDAFAQRKVKKTYVTIAVGNPGENVVIDKPIGRHPVYRQKMRVVPDPSKGRRTTRVAPIFNKNKSAAQVGRRALSYVNSLAFDGKLSVTEVRIETGRTHQIRVHLQDRGCPVYGDDVYGISDWNRKLTKQRGIMRPLLHAHRLEIDHPITGEKMVLCAPMPDDMSKVSDIIWPTGRDERSDLFSVQEQ